MGGSGSGCCSSTSPQRTPPPSLPPSSLLLLTSPTTGHTCIHSQPSSTPSHLCPPSALRGTGLRVQVSTGALGSLSQHPGSRASTLLLTPHPSPPLAPRRRQHLLEFFYLNKIHNTAQVPLSVLKVEDLKIACEGLGMGGSTDRPWFPITTEWLGWVGAFIKCACVCVQALMARGCPHSSCPWTLRPLLPLLHPL